jgi:hypothetical protein
MKHAVLKVSNTTAYINTNSTTLLRTQLLS